MYKKLITFVLALMTISCGTGYYVSPGGSCTRAYLDCPPDYECVSFNSRRTFECRKLCYTDSDCVSHKCAYLNSVESVCAPAYSVWE